MAKDFFMNSHSSKQLVKKLIADCFWQPIECFGAKSLIEIYDTNSMVHVRSSIPFGSSTILATIQYPVYIW